MDVMDKIEIISEERALIEISKQLESIKRLGAFWVKKDENYVDIIKEKNGKFYEYAIKFKWKKSKDIDDGYIRNCNYEKVSLNEARIIMANKELDDDCV